VPKGALALIGGLFVFAVLVVGLVAWALFGGAAGKQRGFIVRSELNEPVTLRFEDGRSALLRPDDRQETFIIKREEFPQTLRAFDADGLLIADFDFEYSELAEAEFRISVDRNGFYPTTDVRTPAP
jgi:hypothetical protein